MKNRWGVWGRYKKHLVVLLAEVSEKSDRVVTFNRELKSRGKD